MHFSFTSLLTAIFTFIICSIVFFSFYKKKNKVNKKKLLENFLTPNEIQKFLTQIEILPTPEINEFFLEIKDLNKDDFLDFYEKIKHLNIIKSYEDEFNQFLKLNKSKDLGTNYYNLGKEYHNKNNEKSFYFYTKSAEHNNIDAKYEIALMYYHGISTEVNFKKSFDFFQDAKEKYYKESSYYLAMMYHYGYGVYRNSNKARLYASAYAISNDKKISEIFEFSQLNKKSTFSCESQSKRNPSTLKSKVIKDSLVMQDEFLNKWNELEDILKKFNKNNNIIFENITLLASKNIISKELESQLHTLRKRRNDFIHNKKNTNNISEKDVILAKKVLNSLKQSI